MSANYLNLFIFFFIFFFSNLQFSLSQQQQIISAFTISISPWTPSQNRTLLSLNSTFAAGFRRLPNSPNLYTFSVWFYNISGPDDVVWSANHNSPVSASGSLIITTDGELRLINSTGSGENLWPERPISNVNRTELTLLPTGNLVYGNWNSFANPTNTYLPNQDINGTRLTTNNGKFMFESQRLIYVPENDTYWTSTTRQDFLLLNDLGNILQAGNQIYYSSDYGVKKLRRLTLDENGNFKLYSYDTSSGRWIPGWQAMFQLCLIHGTCGENFICLFNVSDQSNPTSCVCPPGYRQVNDTCEQKIPITDLQKTKFLRLDFVNFTGGLNQSDIKTTNFSTCEKRCLDDRRCLGFMFKYDGTNYCVLQLERMAFGHWTPGSETVMYLRVDESERDTSNYTGMTNQVETTCPVRIRLPLPPKESKATTRNIAIVSALFAAELLSGVFFFWTFLKKYIKYRDMARTFGLEVMPSGGPKRFTYNELKVATKGFTNPIGKGGFGVVYRGELSDGRVVAVKSLKNITGGDADFWAEVTIIARMHHLNLVRLWGFCAEKGSRILVYEYVSNGSLDEFLFQTIEGVESSESGVESSETAEETTKILSSKKKPILDWNIRYRIALGVARAIAYLHEECLEWVLHCDIKPENILLGEDFCPKVSDFGLAKLKKKEDMMSVSRMRGTPGYMAPEWTRPEPITSKADVYSFGLVLLEIVSGSRNFVQLDPKVESHQWFFPRWAFEKVFKEMNVEDILDHRIKHSYDSREHFDMINRMVKTAMWCLQDRPDMRPSMGKVAKMLEGTVEITEPKEPTIFYLSDE